MRRMLPLWAGITIAVLILAVLCRGLVGLVRYVWDDWDKHRHSIHGIDLRDLDDYE